MSKKQFNTRAVHAGQTQDASGAVIQPIFQSATYLEHEDLPYNDIKYLRLNNSPNHEALKQTLSSLEHTQSALVCASGMSAITTALLANTTHGDHIIAQSNLYGGTYHFLKYKAPKLGLSVSFVDIDDPETWAQAHQTNTKVFYCESISNPLMQIGLLDAVVDFCRQNNMISMIDNTFASPYNFTPADLGFACILHSATKYLNGHSDLVAGVICASTEQVSRCKSYLDIYGGTLDPHACFLLQRGIKTLGLRMQRHNDNAQVLANYLDEHEKIERVYYPSLSAGQLHQAFTGFSGMLAFEVSGGKDAAERLMKHLQIPLHAPSLGGVESLMTRPAASSHSGLSQQERAAMGIQDNLIRLSVGIEDCVDLQDDFTQALAAI